MALDNKKHIAFGKEILIARLRMGIAIKKSVPLRVVAKKLGVTPAYLMMMEHGKKHPNVEMVSKMLKVYPKESHADILGALGIDGYRAARVDKP